MFGTAQIIEPAKPPPLILHAPSFPKIDIAISHGEQSNKHFFALHPTLCGLFHKPQFIE